MNRGNFPLALALVIAGAAAVLVSVFLPMTERTGPFSYVQENTLIQHGGWILVVAAIAIAGSGIRAQDGKDWAVPLAASVLTGIGIALLWAANTGLRTLYPIGANGQADASQPGVVSPHGIAIYVAGVGVAVAIVGSLWLRPDATTTTDLAASPHVQTKAPGGRRQVRCPRCDTAQTVPPGGGTFNCGNCDTSLTMQG